MRTVAVLGTGGCDPAPFPAGFRYLLTTVMSDEARAYLTASGASRQLARGCRCVGACRPKMDPTGQVLMTCKAMGEVPLASAHRCHGTTGVQYTPDGCVLRQIVESSEPIHECSSRCAMGST